MKSMMSKYLVPLVLVGLASGCAAEANDGAGSPATDSEATSAVDTSRELARVEKEGVTYRFIEAEPGEIAMLVGSDEPVDMAQQTRDGDASLTELYEALSGEAAPEALVVAELAAERAAAEAGEAAPEEPAEFDAGEMAPAGARSGDIAQTSQGLTTAQFEAAYCDSGGDFLYCWPNTAGNPWVERWSWYMHGAINALDCHTRYRFRYWKSGWKTLVDRTAAPGSHWYVYQSNYSIIRKRRFEVIDNSSSCGVRFAVYGF